MITVISASNLRWADASHTAIDLLLQTAEFGEIPFTASPDDTEQHGRDIYARAMAGEWGPVAEYQPPPLSDYKESAKNAIDAAAGRARARYITVAPGQEATYQAKAAEADAYVAAGRPSDTTPYPILTAEAQVRGISVSDTADLVRTIRDQWVQLAAAIEAIRIGGKLAVDASSTHGGVNTARDAAISQLDAV
jgi:hypothetical protein